MAGTSVLDNNTASMPPWIGRNAAAPFADISALGDVMDAAAKEWSAVFGGFAGSAVEIDVQNLAVAPVETLAAGRGPDAIVAAVLAPEWGGAFALGFGRDFVAAVVDALFGGGLDEGLEPDRSAPMSSVEQEIAAVTATQVCEALAAAFGERLPTTFRLDRLLPKADLGFLGKAGTPVLVVTFAVKVAGRTLTLDALLPSPLIEPLADRLAAPEAEAPTGIDPRWFLQLQAEVGRAMTTLRATIDLPPMSLGAIARMSAGQMLHLPLGAGSKVRLSCADDELFCCDLGQSAGFYTVRIEDCPSADRLPISGPFGEGARP